MVKNGSIKIISIFFVISLCSVLSCQEVSAESVASLSTGQTVYVPAYSHIYSGNKETPFLLAVTLSIRNTDPSYAITISSADYFDSSGNLLNQYIKKPLKLTPMASTRFIVKASDKAGGSGANFIVAWKSASAISPPIIESIMIGTQSQQGVSFTSRGQVIKEKE